MNAAAQTRTEGPELKLASCVNMAVIAFQAYLEPTKAQEYRNEGTNGTLTQYLSTHFVASMFDSLVKVNVKNSTELPKADVRALSFLVSIIESQFLHKP
jgi:hypothetical protein